MEAVLRAIADPRRREIIRLVRLDERSAGDIAAHFDVSRPAISQHLTILRQAFGHDGRDPLGLYFGAESGEVFGSADGGETWGTVAEHLPPITSVRVSA